MWDSRTVALAATAAAALALASGARAQTCVVRGEQVSLPDVLAMRGAAPPVRVGVDAARWVEAELPLRAGDPAVAHVGGSLDVRGETSDLPLELREVRSLDGMLSVAPGDPLIVLRAYGTRSEVVVDVHVIGIGVLRGLRVPCEMIALVPTLHVRRTVAAATYRADGLRAVPTALRRGPDVGTTLRLSEPDAGRPFEVLDAVPGWRRVRATTYRGSTLVAWLRAGALTKSLPPNVGVIGHGGGCSGVGVDPETALVRDGTPVASSPGGPIWTTTHGDESFLVREDHGLYALLRAPGIREQADRFGCATGAVLGWVSHDAVHVGTFARRDLRAHRAADGSAVLDAVSAALAGRGLRAGDVLVSADGVELPRDAPLQRLLLEIVLAADSLDLVVRRDGGAVALPRRRPAHSLPVAPDFSLWSDVVY